MRTRVYNGKNNLKGVGVVIEYTKEQAEEFAKCAADPTYFIENYAKIISLDRGIVAFDPYPYQSRIVDAMNESRNIVVKLPRQMGKCVESLTDIRVRNKKTGEVLTASIGDFYDMVAE